MDGYFKYLPFTSWHLRRMKSTLAIWHIAGKPYDWLTLLSHKLRCYRRISGLEKSRNNTREKLSYFFHVCWYSQSAADTSLAFGATRSGWWMNGKAFTILNTSCLSEFSRIMAAKTLKKSVSLIDNEVQTFLEGEENQHTKKINRKLRIHWLWC